MEFHGDFHAAIGTTKLSGACSGELDYDPGPTEWHDPSSRCGAPAHSEGYPRRGWGAGGEVAMNSDRTTRERAWIAVRLAVRACAREPSEYNASRVQRTWNDVRQMEEQAIQNLRSPDTSKMLFGPKLNPAGEGKVPESPAFPLNQHCSAQ